MPKLGALADSASDTAVNQNNDTLETAFNNTLSRDGSSPNQMNADLDMNGNDILNVGSINIGTVVADNGIPSGGTQGQLIVKDSATDYDVSWQSNLSTFSIDTLLTQDLQPSSGSTIDLISNALGQQTTLRATGSGFFGVDFSTGERQVAISSTGSITLGWDGNDTTTDIVFSARAKIRSPQASTANLQLTNSGNNGFGLLQFGGVTSSYPAIKPSYTPSAAGLEVKLADDSGFAKIKGKLTTDTNYAAGAPTPTGYLVLYDAAGTAYKVPAEAV